MKHKRKEKVKQLDTIISDSDVLGIALKKAKNYSALSRDSGVGRSTLWRLANGKLQRKSRNSTMKKLTTYILEGE